MQTIFSSAWKKTGAQSCLTGTFSATMTPMQNSLRWSRVFVTSSQPHGPDTPVGPILDSELLQKSWFWRFLEHHLFRFSHTSINHSHVSAEIALMRTLVVGARSSWSYFEHARPDCDHLGQKIGRNLLRFWPKMSTFECRDRVVDYWSLIPYQILQC